MALFLMFGRTIMKKFLAVLGCGVALLSACDNKQESETTSTEPKVETEQVAEKSSNVQQPNNLWENISGEPDKFVETFNKLNETQKYYFCSAFSIGALSVVKPATASAMVNYFFGMGLVKYNEGMNEANYKAFDFGKNVFRYELVVNYILEHKVCENIMVSASEYVNKNKYTAETLSDMGKKEVEKTVQFIKK